MQIKKYISIFMILFMLMSTIVISPLTIDASTTNIYYNDFKDTDIFKAKGSADSYGETSGKFGASIATDSQRFYIMNPDDLTTNDDEVNSSNKKIYAGTGTIAKVADGKYPYSLVFTKSEKFWRSGFGIDVRPKMESNKNVVIKTAIKRDFKDDSDLYITSLGYAPGESASSLNHGYDWVSFMRTGEIYVLGSKVDSKYIEGTNTYFGKYEEGVWYEITIEYTPSTKFATVTIDGGIYDNNIQYSKIMSGNIPERVSVSLRNMVESTTKKGDMHIGYLDIHYSESAKSVNDFKVDTKLDFNDYNIGTLESNAIKVSQNAYNLLSCGIKHHVGATADEDTSIVKFDSAYGKSLKMADYGKQWNQLRFPLEAPYAKPFSEGKNIFEFSIYGGTDMTMLILVSLSDGSTTSSNTTTLTFKDDFNTSSSYLKKHTWLKGICTFDLENGKYTLLFYQKDNPENSYIITKDISAYTNVTQVGLYTGSGSPVDGDATYIDDIHIYSEKPDFDVLDSSHYNNMQNAPILNDIVLNFTHEIKEGVDTISLNGGNLTSDDYEVSLMPCKRTVVIKPKYDLKTLTEYTISISGLKDINDNTINVDEIIKFKTCDNITISPVEFTDESGKAVYKITPGKISASVEISVNDGGAYDFLMVYALYNKSTDELVQIKTLPAQNEPSSPLELEIQVPDDENEYFAEVSILDSYYYLRPYINNFRLEWVSIWKRL